LVIIDEMEELVKKIYGENIFMAAIIHLRKAQIFTEMKGEEYKAEDNLKEYSKNSEKIYNELEEMKEESCLNFTYQVETMSGYLKI